VNEENAREDNVFSNQCYTA